jgi:hypothetical protein
MSVAYAYPEPRFVDTRLLPVPNITGTSSAFATPRSYFSEPTGVEGYPDPISSEAGSAIELLINRSLADFSHGFLFTTRERTSTVNQDYEMSLLETASSIGDEMAFTEVFNAIRWEYRSAEDYLKVVRLALNVGAHFHARKLAAEGGRRFTDNDEMQKYARVLAPSKIVDVHLPPDPDAAADMHWLKAHGEKYRNQWVALRSGILLAAAPSRKDLLAQLENPADKSVLITPVY